MKKNKKGGALKLFAMLALVAGGAVAVMAFLKRRTEEISKELDYDGDLFYDSDDYLDDDDVDMSLSSSVNKSAEKAEDISSDENKEGADFDAEPFDPVNDDQDETPKDDNPYAG